MIATRAENTARDRIRFASLLNVWLDSHHHLPPMSSDGLFDDDDAVYDDAFFEELETNKAGPSQLEPRKSEPVIDVSDDEFGDSFDFDEAALDLAEKIARTRKFGPSRSLQTTLDGDILPEAKTKPRSNVPPARKPSHTVLAPPENRKTKQWDHTEYAKSGSRRSKSKGKGKSRSTGEDDEDEEEAMEFEAFPEPSITGALQYLPRLHTLTFALVRYVYCLVCVVHVTYVLTI